MRLKSYQLKYFQNKTYDNNVSFLAARLDTNAALILMLPQDLRISKK